MNHSRLCRCGRNPAFHVTLSKDSISRFLLRLSSRGTSGSRGVCVRESFYGGGHSPQVVEEAGGPAARAHPAQTPSGRPREAPAAPGGLDPRSPGRHLPAAWSTRRASPGGVRMLSRPEGPFSVTRRNRVPWLETYPPPERTPHFLERSFSSGRHRGARRCGRQNGILPNTQFPSMIAVFI